MRQALFLIFLAAGPVPAAAPPVGADDAHDLILLHPKRPYRVRFHLRFAGRPFHAGWSEQVGRLFAYLDQNGDGRLSKAEASLAPSREQWRQLSGGKEAIDADAAPPFEEVARGKGYWTLSDLQAHYAASAAGPLRVGWGWRNRLGDPLAKAVWTKLDTDRDGKLDRAELLAARRIVAPLDLDDDDLVSQSELVGNIFYQGPLAMTPSPPHGLAHGGLPFFSVVPGAPAEMVTDLLRKRYKHAVAADPDLVLEVPLDDPSRPLRKLVGPSDGMVYVATPRGETLRLDGWVIDFARPVPLPRLGTKRKKEAMLEFRQFDSDSNGYLDNTDLYRPPLTFVSWLRLADRDGDGKVTAKEFTDFWELKDTIQGSVTFLQVEDQGHSLFQLLDQNDDGRLGPRELNEARARLLPSDRGRGFLSRESLPELYRLTIGHGHLPAPAESPNLPPVKRLPSRGPLWFRKMDHNGDGDVSRKEWLGSRQQFDKLDLDGDGLISLEEATQADRRR